MRLQKLPRALFTNHQTIFPRHYERYQKIPRKLLRSQTIFSQTMINGVMIICMPRYFYRSNYPKAAKEDDIGLTNLFVAFTHAIGLSHYFSFTPPLFDRDAWRAQHGAGSKKDYDHTTNPPISQ